ncbi:hypothetical protein EJ110_NYTH35829 [Nymphaea thermarum]|nr:hypothetical protein EJ110_NYTH35829 [Nymphaea thermarum]
MGVHCKSKSKLPSGNYVHALLMAFLPATHCSNFCPIQQLETVYSVTGLTWLKIGIPRLLLLLLLSIHIDRAISGNQFLYTRYSVAANYTDGDEFEVNMDSVFSTLKNEAPSIGFLNTTMGQGPEGVYGLVQCRGDVGKEECKSCITRSTIEIVQYCPNTKDAIIWFENIVDFPEAFYGLLTSSLKNITSAATTEPSRLMFARNETEYTIRQTLYGLVQCTGDTSLTDCKNCLETAISQINSTTCGDSKGCELLKGSCRVRFDTNIFIVPQTQQAHLLCPVQLLQIQALHRLVLEDHTPGRRKKRREKRRRRQGF